MSVYLLNFTIGQFDFVELFTKSGVRVRGYTPIGMSHMAYEHTKIGAEAVELYEDYFKVKYPLPKLDFVTYHFFSFRAMENWGIITMQRNCFLDDPKTTRSETFQRNARTIAHEVSHMWFGNFVTMEWWDDLWLNEGFARYAEHYILDKLRPEYCSWAKFLKQVNDKAF